MERLHPGLRQPIFDEIDSASSILLVGNGGGYDCYHTLPLYFYIQHIGKQAHIANMSFSELKECDAEILFQQNNIARSTVLIKFTADTSTTKSGTPAHHFVPEKYLSMWFREALSQEVPVYTFLRRGAIPLSQAYSLLIQRLNIDLIILLDGGSVSLMAGDEHEIGNNLENLLNIFAVNEVGIKCILCCIGVGVDRYNGVSDVASLRAIAELTEAGAFLGSFSLLPNMPEFEYYEQALEYANSRMEFRKSVVGHLITSAVRGKFGNYNTLEATSSQNLFVFPLMSILFFFQLDGVIDRMKFTDFVEETKTANDLLIGVEYFRKRNRIRPVEEFPRTHEY